MTDESSPWLGATRETVPIRPRSNFHFYGFETSLTISEKVIVSYVCIPGKHICLRNLILLVKKKFLKGQNNPKIFFSKSIRYVVDLKFHDKKKFLNKKIIDTIFYGNFWP